MFSLEQLLAIMKLNSLKSKPITRLKYLCSDMQIKKF